MAETESGAYVTTCLWTEGHLPSLLCCRFTESGYCGREAPYAALYEQGDGVTLIEHLRCVDHAADARADGHLIAMKTVSASGDSLQAGT